MDNVFLKPALVDGKPVVVPDPETHRPLKADGEWKPLSMYWARRLRDKDVIESAPPAAPEKPTAPAPAAPAKQPAPEDAAQAPAARPTKA